MGTQKAPITPMSSRTVATAALSGFRALRCGWTMFPLIVRAGRPGIPPGGHDEPRSPPVAMSRLLCGCDAWHTGYTNVAPSASARQDLSVTVRNRLLAYRPGLMAAGLSPALAERPAQGG